MADQEFSLSAPIAPTHRTRVFQAPGAVPAALLVVLLAVAIGVIGLRPPGNHPASERTIPAVALSSDTTPVSSPALETTCTTPPGDLARLELTGPTTAENVIMPADGSMTEAPVVSMDWRNAPEGTSATQAQIDGVSETVFAFVACLNENNAESASALFTDDYWRRLNTIGLSPDPTNISRFLGVRGTDQADEIANPEVRNARVLPDGRVAADIVPAAQQGEYYTLAVFTEQDGKWLVDEAARVIKNPSSEISVDDNGFSAQSILITNGKTEITLTNTGTRPHSIVCLELNLRIELQAGETAYQTISYEEAELPFYSDMPGDEGPAFQGVITIDYPGEPATPEAAPEYESPGPGFINPGLMARIDVSSPSHYDPSAIALLANRDASIVITNTNPWNEGHFRIDALGIDVKIPVGESVTVPINAPPGIYVFYSAEPYSAINGMYGTLIVIDPESMASGFISPDFMPSATPTE